METKIHIYTDGACSGNPGPGGTGYVIIIDGIHVSQGASGYKKTTNNRMEILAVSEALKKAKKIFDEFSRKRDTDVKVTVFSDSQLVIQTMAGGWARKTNKDLWKRLDNTIAETGFDVTFSKVKGHADNTYNNLADELAVDASKNPTWPDKVYEQIAKEKDIHVVPIGKSFDSFESTLFNEEPRITSIRFNGEDTPSNREIEVALTNGTILRILPLYEGFQCVDCTKKESSLVTDIAFKYNGWLQGKKNF